MKDQEAPRNEVQVDELTWREQEILALLAERLSNKEIASQLHLAESTVKDYVGRILSKLYVKNRRQAVERAKALGLLDGEQRKGAKPQISLPAERTPFVGRGEELEEIARLLGETRMLTLVGPGGIGKTRLAVKAAEQAAGGFEDGCFFVPLAPISASEHIIQTIAEVVGFPLATQEDPQTQLLRFLAPKQMLLVLDNFEHVIEGAGIVGEMLAAAPGVKALVSSREKLNLQSETALQVGGMLFPYQAGLEEIGEYDAVALFVQSAGKVRPGFAPKAEEWGKIARICQMAAGMPLAIELAAAWLNLLSLDEIAEELSKGLDILAAEVRDAPERHQSIRAVFDYSWKMMEPAEREVFKRLSVFRGGFSREAAEQVAEATLVQLGGLVNKSFLGRDHETGRFEVHELLRQYVQERLDADPVESAEVREKHGAYFAVFIQGRSEAFKGAQQMQALVEIEADIENVRRAWRYYLANKNVPQMKKLVFGLWQLYRIRWWNHAGMVLFGEAARVLEGEIGEEIIVFQAAAKVYQSYFMAWLGLSEQGYELLEESLPVLEESDQKEVLVLAYYSMTVNAYMLNRYPEFFVITTRLIEIVRDIGDPWLTAFALFAVGMGELVMGNYDRAREVAEEHRIICEELGDVLDSTTPLIVLGHVALAQGDYQEARKRYMRCLEIAEEVGFHYSRQTASKYLGNVELLLGDLEAAEKYLVMGLEITRQIGFIRDIVVLILEFAQLRAAQGRLVEAVELLSLVAGHPASDQSRWLHGRVRDRARDLLAEVEGELSGDEFAAALGRGEGLGLDEVVAGLLG